MKTVSIIIPVYNERETILRVIDAVRNALPDFSKEIIVVDDFSIDGTREQFKFLNIENLKIFFNDKNRGKGYSVRRGLKEAGGDFIIIQDADLEYNPEEYQKLLEPLLKGEADVVYGSRFKDGKFIFKPYYLANRFLTTLSNLFTGFHLTDMETCYKCFSKTALDKIKFKLKANRFDIEPEITAVVAKMALKIKEVPISYERRSYLEGKKIGFKDGLQAIWAIVKFGFI